MENKKKLGLFSLVCIATGNVVGAGIITTTGLAIAETGRSVWIAYGLAVLFGFLWMYPSLCFASVAKHKGGAYTMSSTLMGPLWGGIYSLTWLPMFLMIGMLTMGFGMYATAIFPFMSAKMWSLVGGTVFFVANLFGVKAMAKLQNPTTIFLLVCLLAFAIIGFGHLSEGAFAVTSSEYYLNGGIGIFDGMMLLIFSTSGHALVSGLSWDAEKPKKNIPLAIMITTGIIMLLYCSVSFVAGNVLPVDVVAGQPLTYVAKVLFPGALFYVFMIGGPLMALATSLNAGYATMVAPAMGAAMNGWLPSGVSKKNKFDAPWILYIIMYVVSVGPILANISLNMLTSYTVMTMRTGAIILLVVGYAIPTKLKDQWEKSWMHVPNAVFYTINTIALATNVFCTVYSIKSLGAVAFTINLAVELILAAYAVYRYKAKKTTEAKLLVSYDED